VAVSSVAICVEGVLQKNVSSAPISTGICLYHGLASTFNVLLITESDKTHLDYWLALEGLDKHSAVEYNEHVRTFMSEEQRKLHQVGALRLRKYNVDLVIDPNPSSAALLLSNGYSVMLMTHALYALPQWRPDYEGSKRTWDEIETYELLQAQLRAVDMRMSDKEDSD
jgi:hypothetical protein